uniref:Uncharacterized protein n=1 Tax=Rhizophora mucronata TaxID=61149 RepID=A0A2P2J0G4_RHIMU
MTTMAMADGKSHHSPLPNNKAPILPTKTSPDQNPTHLFSILIFFSHAEPNKITHQDHNFFPSFPRMLQTEVPETRETSPRLHDNIWVLPNDLCVESFDSIVH